MLHLIEYLLTNYQSDPVIMQMINKTRIHIMPSMNPDGFENSAILDCNSVIGRYVRAPVLLCGLVLGTCDFFYNIRVLAKILNFIINLN